MRTIVVVLMVLLARLAAAQTPAPTRPIAEVIAELSDPSPKVRSKAASTLGRHYGDQPQRFDPLEKAATSDADSLVRMIAISALGPAEVGKAPRWQKLYLKVLTTDASEHCRSMAAKHLTPADASTVDTLIAVHKKDSSSHVRGQIVTALVDGKVPNLADLLVKIVETHPEPGHALGALARTGDPRAIPLLKAAAKRTEKGIINSALDSLVGIPGAVVDDILLEFLAGPPELQWDTVRAIVNARRVDPRQVPLLVKLWQAQPKAARKRSVTKLEAFDNLEADEPIHGITRQLRETAETLQAPCEARTAAKGELKTYLTKILPTACGKP